MIVTCFRPVKNLPPISLVVKDGALIALDWYQDKYAKLLDKLGESAQVVPCDELGKSNNHAIAKQAITELCQYFAGERQSFDVPIWLLGTPFQRQVWQALCQIPYGQTISYKQLAQDIGKPLAYRACANANGQNPISLIVPCHRVIAADGGLGGYTGGLEIKKTLLAIEGVVL